MFCKRFQYFFVFQCGLRWSDEVFLALGIVCSQQLLQQLTLISLYRLSSVVEFLWFNQLIGLWSAGSFLGRSPKKPKSFCVCLFLIMLNTIGILVDTDNWSVIWQRGRISKRVFKENKGRQRTCAYQEVTNVRFMENLTCFVFLKHPF